MGPNGLKDVLIISRTGIQPARTKLDGDSLVIDIKDVPAPFKISYAASGSLKGKNGLPVSAFSWSAARVLKCTKCEANTIELQCKASLDHKIWTAVSTYAISGAAVTNVKLVPTGVILTTDKTWKAGDTVNLTYPCFPVDQGEPRSESLTFTVSENPAPLKSGGDVVLSWKLKDWMGSTAEDASENLNDGTLNGRIAWVEGRSNGALSFPAGSNSGASVASINGLTPGNTPHTIMAWIKIAKLPETRAWLLLLGGEGDGSHHWLINPAGGTAFGTWGGPQLSPKLEVGKWTHVAMTFDGTTLISYLNGEKSDTVSGNFNLKGIPLTVAQSHLGENCFEGELDDLRIYNRALSAKEIAEVAK